MVNLRTFSTQWKKKIRDDLQSVYANIQSKRLASKSKSRVMHAYLSNWKAKWGNQKFKAIFVYSV